ncbi:MFS transporter [Glutamicibacter endophyticus]|uniref:MFS transporter n=1 Tax=Glutamicibacter endophyticus TaxID=1522174 RepID=UPI003AEF82B6
MHAKYLLFIALAFCSLIGDGLAMFALTLAAADELGSWGVSALFLAGLIPPILAAPWLGRWVDGQRVRGLWLATLLCHALVFTLMAALDSIWVSLAGMCVASICAVFSSSAVFKLIPEIRGSFSLARASSLLVAAGSLAGILSPALAALGYDLWGLRPLLLVNAGSFLFFAVVAWFLLRSQSTAYNSDVPEPFTGLRGARVLTSNGTLRILLVPIAAVVFFTSTEAVSGVFYLRAISPNDTVYGMLLGLWSVGAVLGSLSAGGKLLGQRVSLPVLLGAGLIGAAITLEGLWPNAVAIGVAFLIGGYGNGMHNLGLRNAIYRLVPQERHGAAWAYVTMLINSMVALGYLAGTPGFLIESEQLIVTLSGVCALAAVLGALGLVLRNYRRTAQTKPVVTA